MRLPPRAWTIAIRSRDLCAFSVADLQTITAGILEKDGVVVRFFVGRPFDIPRAGLDRDCSEPINLVRAVRPKRDSTLIGHMCRRLCHPEKLGRAISTSRLILQPPFNRGIARKPECGQQHFIKRPRLGEAAHSEINVIETPSHTRKIDSDGGWPVTDRLLPEIYRVNERGPAREEMRNRAPRGESRFNIISGSAPDWMRDPGSVRRSSDSGAPGSHFFAPPRTLAGCPLANQFYDVRTSNRTERVLGGRPSRRRLPSERLGSGGARQSRSYLYRSNR